MAERSIGLNPLQVKLNFQTTPGYITVSACNPKSQSLIGKVKRDIKINGGIISMNKSQSLIGKVKRKMKTKIIKINNDTSLNPLQVK